MALESRESESFNIICGDCNGDIGNIPGGRGHRQPSKAGKLVQDFCTRHRLWASNMIATGPIDTYCGPTGCSTIDYVLIPQSIELIVTRCGVIGGDALNTSDHNPVFATCNFQTVPNPCIDIERVKVLRWDKIGQDVINDKYTTFVSEVLNTLLDELDTAVPCNALVDNTFTRVSDIIPKAASRLPKSRFKKHLKPFWCPEMNILKNQGTPCLGGCYILAQSCII